MHGYLPLTSVRANAVRCAPGWRPFGVSLNLSHVRALPEEFASSAVFTPLSQRVLAQGATTLSAAFGPGRRKVLSLGASSTQAMPPPASVSQPPQGKDGARALFNGKRFEYSNPFQGLKNSGGAKCSVLFMSIAHRTTAP